MIDDQQEVYTFDTVTKNYTVSDIEMQNINLDSFLLLFMIFVDLISAQLVFEFLDQSLNESGKSIFLVCSTSYN